MANYITLNGKNYATTGRNLRPVLKKAQQIRISLSGKTLSQEFSFTDQRWQVRILVELYPPDPSYGSKTDLETAYSLAYCNFVDQFGWDQGDVFMVGNLEEALDWALVDESAPFEVELNLRKRQV